MDICEMKNQIRREYFAKRRAIQNDKRIAIDQAICRALLECEFFKSAEAILFYAPKEPEVDISPLFDYALSMNKRIAFPRCEKDNTLAFHYAEPNQLILGHFGILEPKETAPICRATDSSICLVPALLFDSEGFRLGYGKGYYDRFLSDYHGKSIGIARNDFILPKLPRDTFDLAVDILASETGVCILS